MMNVFLQWLEDWRTGGHWGWVHFDRTMETKDRKPSVILVTVIKTDIDTEYQMDVCRTDGIDIYTQI